MQIQNITNNKLHVINDPLVHSTQSDLDELRNNGWEMLHNAEIYSFVYGPVAVYEGLPYYFNGKHLLIDGYSISQSAVTASLRTKRLLEMILSNYSKLTTVEYWGEEKPDINMNKGLKIISNYEPSDSNRDVILDLRKISNSDINANRFVRKARKNKLVALIRKEKQITANHTDLVNNFLCFHPTIDQDGANYISQWERVLNRESSVLFEIYSESKLTGFAILSLFCKDMPTYAYGFYDNNISGTSDLAHSTMINYCIERNFNFMDLGYSINSTLMRYKLKWGSFKMYNAPWNLFWRRV